MAHMKKTQYGKVDLDYVLGIGGFDLERFVYPLYLLKGSSAIICFSFFSWSSLTCLPCLLPWSTRELYILM